MIIGKKQNVDLKKGKAPEEIQVEVKRVLERFQKGYTERNLESIDEYMDDLFTKDEDLTVVGTGDDEWCIGFDEVKELVEMDWKYWGDVTIDIEGSMISSYGNVAWVTTEGMLNKNISKEEFYNNYIEGIKEDAKSDMSPKDKMIDILKTVANCFHEINLGEEIVRPFRLTTILVKKNNVWKFHHMQFSHSTVWPADVRIVNDNRVC